MPNLEDVVWAQEEPKNNGAWFLAEPFIEQCLADAKVPVARARYAGRTAAASPATGLMKRHQMQQGALLAEDRKRVVEGKRVAVRVEFGGHRSNKKQN